MLNANKEVLASFFQGKTQYVIPFFQRAYVWNESNWIILWEHLIDIFNEMNENVNINKEHFIGTLITKQLQAVQIGDSRNELIDGQQRLSTILILLKALHDTCSGELSNLQNTIRMYLSFKDTKGDTFLRLTHNRHDKEYYDLIMTFEEISSIDNSLKGIKEEDNLIIDAYRFFRNMTKDFNDNDREKMMQIILYKVPVISMLLSPTDDEQEIFDTINSLGVRLTIAELLKNYIFHDISIRTLFDEYWGNVFEVDEDIIKFWNESKTTGRVRRTNIEVLLYCFLIINTEHGVEIEKLYQEYKNWLKEKNSDEKKIFLEELKNYAEIYFGFPNENELNEFEFNDSEKRFFHVIENLEITTVYPLVLFIYKNIKDLEERKTILNILESYLVRRNVCGLSTKNYNNLFIAIIRDWKKSDKLNANSLSSILESFTEDSNLFPTDEIFLDKFNSNHLYNAYAKEILYCILLKMIDSPLDDVRKISSSSFSVEHILPKKWEENWSEPEFTDEEKQLRKHLLLTLGNLTLVTGNLNSKMKNSSWEKKKKILKEYSKLKITTKYLDVEKWCESTIIERGKELFNVALEIWKR